jgi:Fe-S-cluster containining protein
VCKTSVKKFLKIGNEMKLGRAPDSEAAGMDTIHQEREAPIASSNGPCQTCGACCAHAREWPRFTLESDAEIALIPEPLIATDGSGMRCEGERCAALAGRVGVAVSCTIYAARPIVCRDCMPGDDACTMARAARGLPALA